MGQPDAKNSKTIAIITGVVSIIVAAIGCIGAIAAAGIEPFATWVFNRTPVPPLASASPTELSASPIPPIVEPATVTPDVACALDHACSAGEDWENSCIAGYNWTIYSSSDFPEILKDENDCYSQPILDVFYTKSGGLSIFAQPKALTTSKDYGLFYQLPQSGTVSVSVDLDKIDNGQVWFGIFERPDAKSKGVLLVAPPGEVREQAFALKTMPEDQRIEVSKIFQSSSGKYTLGFTLEFGSIIANAEGISMTPIPFTSPTRWLFVGYRAKLDDPLNGSADIQALFTDLKIGQ